MKWTTEQPSSALKLQAILCQQRKEAGGVLCTDWGLKSREVRIRTLASLGYGTAREASSQPTPANVFSRETVKLYTTDEEGFCSTKVVLIHIPWRPPTLPRTLSLTVPSRCISRTNPIQTHIPGILVSPWENVTTVRWYVPVHNQSIPIQPFQSCFDSCESLSSWC